MRMSFKGLMALIHSEAVVLTRYLDSQDVWTIGVGHTAAAGGINPGTFKGTLTMKQVIEMLRKDIKQYERDVNEALKVSVTQPQFDALVHFHYNTGGIKRAKLTRNINAGRTDRGTVRRGFMGWLKNPELKSRRETEIAMFFGDYPPETASIYKANKSGRINWRGGRKVSTRELLGRANDTVADLRKAGSRNIKKADMVQAGGGALVALTGVETALDTAERVKGAAERGKDLLSIFSDIAVPLLAAGAVIAVGVSIFIIARNWKQLRLQMHHSGEHI